MPEKPREKPSGYWPIEEVRPTERMVVLTLTQEEARRLVNILSHAAWPHVFTVPISDEERDLSACLASRLCFERGGLLDDQV